MVNVKEYNRREKANLEELTRSKKEEKEYWEKIGHGFEGGSKESKKIDSFWKKQHKLNPLSGKDSKEHPGSLYDWSDKCYRKLPLTSIDGKIINIIEPKLKDWNFLQVRTAKRFYGVEYVIGFEHTNNREKHLEKYLADDDLGSSIDYKDNFLKDMGFGKKDEERLKSVVSEKYRLNSIKATANANWPAQGEGFGPDLRYMFVVLELENKGMKKKELKHKAVKLKKDYEKAKLEYRNYK